jgi:hypothetical protein
LSFGELGFRNGLVVLRLGFGVRVSLLVFGRDLLALFNNTKWSFASIVPPKLLRLIFTLD